MAKKKNTIEVQGLTIHLDIINENDFINITDIAKQNSERKAADIITSWLRNSKTLLFLQTWEQLHNENFKVSHLRDFRMKIQDERFHLSIQKYIDESNAIGLKSKSGRYGGTFAHSEIAFDFCSWFNPQFKVYLYNEFRRFKEAEAVQLGQSKERYIKREVSKLNHGLVTDSIKTNLIPAKLPVNQKGIVYAVNADLLNLAIFGMTAKEWRTQNPKAKGNIRDNANLIDLLLIANLQVIDAHLIKWNCDIEERKQLLNESVKFQRKILGKSKVVKRLNK